MMYFPFLTGRKNNFHVTSNLPDFALKVSLSHSLHFEFAYFTFI